MQISRSHSSALYSHERSFQSRQPVTKAQGVTTEYMSPIQWQFSGLHCSTRKTCVLFRCAQVCMQYLPLHGSTAILSFILNANGSLVIIVAKDRHAWQLSDSFQAAWIPGIVYPSVGGRKNVAHWLNSLGFRFVDINVKCRHLENMQIIRLKLTPLSVPKINKNEVCRLKELKSYYQNGKQKIKKVCASQKGWNSWGRSGYFF